MTDIKNIDATQLHGPEHVRVYEETDGEVGHDWRNDSAILILTTTGRKSGEERKNALIYGLDGNNNPVIVASKGGNPQHPGWYVNLRENPEVRVQIYGDKFTAKARDATPEERAELWSLMTKEWPPYDEYQEKTDREIPVVILEREGGNLDPKFTR